MLKIVKNPNTFENVLDIVFKGISEPSLLSRVQLYKFYLIKEFENYEESTTKGDGFKISTYNFSKKNNIDRSFCSRKSKAFRTKLFIQ